MKKKNYNTFRCFWFAILLFGFTHILIGEGSATSYEAPTSGKLFGQSTLMCNAVILESNTTNYVNSQLSTDILTRQNLLNFSQFDLDDSGMSVSVNASSLLLQVTLIPDKDITVMNSHFFSHHTI